jgi:hypothetical protein
MNGGCSCDPRSRITRLTVAGAQVSLSGVSELFAEWRAAKRQAAELSREEILAGLRKGNYVSSRVEAEYAEAVRALYACTDGDRC